ncbi:hypothetical protein NQ318_002478 [Aromia moschata]|uniref:Laminin IV type B domain-containing protein n=1 Tax=Aromia moschata TaxID=1265417 RepID=A0AAV8Y7H8_9CUCU|nr:hypothetical protein NQ318_002478 [Aromia moschata]
MTGRTCDVPREHFFTASLDFLLYEAEISKTSGQVVIREPNRDGRPDTWTGTGFVKAFEGNYLEFIVDDIKTSLDYDIVIKYEPVMPNVWEDVVVTIQRPDYDQPDPEGPCARMSPNADEKHTNLPPNSRSVTVYPPACLEAGKTYKVILEFRRYSYEKENPSASVLIDSIALIQDREHTLVPRFHCGRH